MTTRNSTLSGLAMAGGAAFPSLGHLLRTLLNAGGYRKYLVDRGLDKDLDDLAKEAKDRQGHAYELLQKIEDAISEALIEDCGSEQAQLFRTGWYSTRKLMQELVQQVDITPISIEQGSSLFEQYFTVPVLSGFLRRFLENQSNTSVEDWIASPFKSWLKIAAAKSGLDEKTILDNLANKVEADQRTIDRWLSGEPIGRLVWPFRATVSEAVAGKEMADSDINFLTARLVLACSIQSVSPDLKEKIKNTISEEKTWSLNYAALEISLNIERHLFSMRAELEPLKTQFLEICSSAPGDSVKFAILLERFQELMEGKPLEVIRSFCLMYDRFSANHAAINGDMGAALQHYARAVTGSWWCAGPNQKYILNEALIYAVGVGDKKAANAYWDKTFMLGLNNWPKRPLDAQEMRRIAFAFEQEFAPQKAKDRIPPPFRVVTDKDRFSLGSRERRNPNQKTAYADGRVRYTPLMRAVREGTLEEVKWLITVGGDPDDWIPESGEGPLSFAMRRAWQQKNTAIMDYILGLELSRETVNRPASTMRETPLMLAISMGNAKAVSRLIELGADVEAACGNITSALCYAITYFKDSLQRDDPIRMSKDYLAGKTPADIYDAKDSVALDTDLAVRREHFRVLANASDENLQILGAVFKHYICPPENYRAVIQALMDGGADANCQYCPDPQRLEKWTPTLFVAEIGDLDVFRMLVEHPGDNRGDPDLMLMPPNSIQRFDALWVAVAYKQQSIVSYLQEREGRVKAL